MMIDHGPNQPVWEAFIDFAVAHASGPCTAGAAPAGHGCPESAALGDAQMALLEVGFMQAADGHLRWIATQLLDTLRVNAGVAGHTSTALAFKDRACTQILAASVRGDEAAMQTVLAEVIPDGDRLGPVLFELTTKLAAALIVRHQQLATEVPA